MNLTIERAHHLLKSAQSRYDDVATGFGSRALSLAEADEELLYADQLVEESIERVARSHRLV